MVDLSCILLDCGERDINVLTDIDEDILEEAVKELKDEGIPLNFPNLYYECAKTALEKCGLTVDDAEIDCNYICAAIYLRGGHEDKAEELEKLGFIVYY